MESKPTEEQIQQFVNEILAEWIPYAINTITYKLEKKYRQVTTGSLSESVVADYVQANLKGEAVATILFQTYGRYLDIKRKLATRKPMPEDVIQTLILDYVKSKGLGAFQYVPGYKNKESVNEDRALKRIAWGIGKSRKNYKVTGWRYSKAKTSLVLRLTEKLSVSYAEVTQKMIVQNLNTTA